MKKRSEPKRGPTQKDIAITLGISRGTVDRALHNRQGISSKTKALVIRKAKELGYSPNKIAQLLVTGRMLNIAMITPADPLWIRVKQGASSFLSELGGLIVKINWHETNVHDPVQDVGIVKSILEGEVDGLGIVPADPDMLRPWIDRAIEAGIPVVTLNTDSPKSHRLCYVGQDPIRAGRIAGELMAKFLRGKGTIVIIAAFKNVLVHRHRLEAFRQVLGDYFPGIRIEGVYENHDSPEEAYLLAKRIFRNNASIDGIYLTTGNGPSGVARALQEAGMSGRAMICYDFFSETVELLKKGIVSAAIGEDPFSQGYQTIKVLYNYITDRKKPVSDSVFTRIDIGLRENIDTLVKYREKISNAS